MASHTSRLALWLGLVLVTLTSGGLVAYSSFFNANSICVAPSKALLCFSKIPSADDLDSVRIETTLGYLQSMNYDDLGTEIVRVTEKGMFGPGDYLPAHRYSRRQAWNSDESLFDLGRGLVNADDFSVFLDRTPVSTERVWSNSDPDVMMGIIYDPDPVSLSILNVRTLEIVELNRWEEFSRCSIGEGEGNQSLDDRYIVIVCDDNPGRRTMISYDIEQRIEIGRLEAKPTMNWVSVTPSGKYIVVENNGTEDLNELEELYRYSPDFSSETLLTNDRNHGDLGIDSNGNDVFVMVSDNRIRYIEIESGSFVDLAIASKIHRPGHGHVSCRNVKRPGWCYLSANVAGVVGAFELTKDNSVSGKFISLFSTGDSHSPSRFELWGLHGSSYESYASQPKVSVSPSGDQLVFSSDWYRSGSVHDYVIRSTQ